MDFFKNYHLKSLGSLNVMYWCSFQSYIFCVPLLHMRVIFIELMSKTTFLCSQVGALKEDELRATVVIIFDRYRFCVNIFILNILHVKSFPRHSSVRLTKTITEQ